MNRPRFVSKDGLIIECQLDIHEATDTLRQRMGHLWSLASRLLEKTDVSKASRLTSSSYSEQINSKTGDRNCPRLYRNLRL
jgi:hypothetical protein